MSDTSSVHHEDANDGALLLHVVHGHHAVALLHEALGPRVLDTLQHAVLGRRGTILVLLFLGDNHRHQAAREQALAGDGLRAALCGLKADLHAAVARHHPHDHRLHRPVLGDVSRCVAIGREHHNHRRFYLGCGEHSAGGEGLDGAHGRGVASQRLVQQRLAQRVVVDALLRLLADAGHHLHRVHRVGPGCGLPGEHHAVRAVQDGVGHVRRLRARRPGGCDHGVQHLGGSDDGLSHHIAFPNHHLLDPEDLRQRNLHT
mmetsp:Transcript_36539/g.61553  ORF Transcript_36539/g.61553 Transcript_36539/m.61553 type:complete len:259 (+) Transcript_36539:67-843(+)